MNEKVHLDRGRLERLWEELRGDLRAKGGPLRADAEHVSSCEQCRREWEMLRGAARDLRPLPPIANHEPGPGCPSEEDLRRVAAGLPARGDTGADALLEHAAQCDHCGAILREGVTSFSNAVTAEEESGVAALGSSQPQWQREIALRMSAHSHRAARAGSGSGVEGQYFVVSRRPAWVLAAAAVLLIALIGGGVALWRMNRAPDVNALLAQAYTEQRPMELRISGAAHGPIRVERSAGGRSTFQRPAALLEAQAQIAKMLAAEPNNPRWLAASGRAELLVWNYDAAIKLLERAQDYGDNSPDTLIDLASAYFQRAEAEANRAVDYGKAIELLSRALQQRPGEAVALYNRAITREKMYLFSEAAADWESYLQAEPGGRWADEARVRAKDLREKAKAREKPQARLREDAREAIPLLAERVQHASPATPEWPAALDESYFTILMNRWLVDFNEPGRAAGQHLAQIFRAYHKDEWLADLLADAQRADLSGALRELGLAAASNQEGKYDAALEHARASLSAFRRYASRAGMAAARYQSIYALQRAQRSRECMAEASLLHGEIAHSEYTHLRGWLAIQQASCTGQGGEIERSREYSREALKIAKGAALDSLALRALNALVSAENEAAHHEGVWNSGREALAIFWSGYHPPSRALNLYMDLMFWGEETANWHTAVSIGREAAWAAQQMHDPLGEAITRHRLARAEYMARNVARSSAELLQANRLFDSLESTPADRVYRMDAEIDLAALEAERGEAAAARRRLEAVRGDLAHTQSYVMPLHFYRALGHVEVLEGRLEQAEASLRQAIGIAEKARSSLANETERHIWGRESGKAARALVRVKLRQGRQLDALAEWEQVQSSWRAGRASTMEIREGLAGAQPSSRIAYAVYEDGIQIWWSRRGVAGWQSHWVDLPRERLRRAAQRFYDACSNPRSDLAALRRDAQELYRWLVEPAAAVLEDEQLYIVTDRELALIPFAALVDAQGRWLAEKTAVVFAMNLRSAEMNAGALPKDWSKLHALIVAPSVPAGLASEFPPLPDAVAEAEMVAGYFPRHTLLVGREATLENVLRALPSAEIFHFAGHARWRAGGIELIFSDAPVDNSVAGVRPALFLRSAPLKLVVLSACSTAAQAGPENRAGSVDLLMGAGETLVAATRWNVQSNSTQRVLERSYENMRKGKSLRLAFEIGKEGMDVSGHPYFWANFGLYAVG